MTRLSRALQMVSVMVMVVVCLGPAAVSRADIRNGDFADQGLHWSVETDDAVYREYEGSYAYWIGEPGDEEARRVVAFEDEMAVLEESPRYIHDNHTHGTTTGVASFTRIQQDLTLLDGENLLGFAFEASGGGRESDYFDVLLTELLPGGTLGATRPFDVVSSHETALSTVSGIATLPIFDLPRGDYRLTFRITGYNDGPGVDPMFVQIDDVHVCAVPLPGAVVLGSLGLGAAGWFCRRMRV